MCVCFCDCWYIKDLRIFQTCIWIMSIIFPLFRYIFFVSVIWIHSLVGHSLPPMHHGMRHRKYVAKYPEGLMIGRPNQSQPQLIYNQPCHSQQMQHSNVLNRPLGLRINKHSQTQTQPQQPDLSLNQSYHLQQSQQTTSQAQPSHSQADTAGILDDKSFNLLPV